MGAQYFVTFRLAGTLPKNVIEDLKILRRQLKNNQDTDISLEKIPFRRAIFDKYEKALDFGNTGPTWLKNKSVANVVQEAIHYRDSKEYNLYAYCIMANHVHIGFELGAKNTGEKSDIATKENKPVTAILGKLKGYTAYESNRILNRKGAFWQSESYDRVIRNRDELKNRIRYTLNNPVKAGLVNTWTEWPYSYCRPEFIRMVK